MLLFFCCQFALMFDGNGQKRSLLLVFLVLVFYTDQINLDLATIGIYNKHIHTAILAKDEDKVLKFCIFFIQILINGKYEPL